MKLVESVHRYPDEERVFDPAQRYVEAFNELLTMIHPDTAHSIDYIVEEIINVRLRQNDVITRGSETSAMYHTVERAPSSLAYPIKKDSPQ